MCGLLLTCPLLGTWLATQACALTGNQTSNFGSQAGTQSTEPHQPGLLNSLNNYINFFRLSKVLNI